MAELKSFPSLASFLLLVTVFPEDVKLDSRPVGDPAKGRVLRQQVGYFKKPGSRFPELFKFSLPDDQALPYPAGEYFIHPDSFKSGDYDSLELNRFGFKLLPVPNELQLKSVA